MTTLFRTKRPKGPLPIRRDEARLLTPRLEPLDITGPTTPPGPDASPDGADVPEVVAGQIITSTWGTDVADDLAELHSIKVSSERSILTTLPLSGGGDLSADRTLTVVTFAGSTPGAVPASPGGTDTYLRADGTWAVPPGGGTPVTDGDKGDIVVSASGATWMLDSAVVTPVAKTLLDDATIPAMRTTLGLVIGTNVQAWDADLNVLSSQWVTRTPTTPDRLLMAEATDNGTNSLQFRAPDAIAADRIIRLPDADGTIALLTDITGPKTQWITRTATLSDRLLIFEASNNGSNYVQLKVPDAIASDVTVTIPSTAGTLALTSDLAAYQPAHADLTDLIGQWTPAGAGTTAALAFSERTGNGTNRVILCTANAIGADQFVVLPEPTTTDFVVYNNLAATLANKTLTDPKITVAINAQTGTTYTLVLTDASKLVTLANAAAITLTVPTNATVAFPVGATIDLAQTGAGKVTVAGAGGVTVNATPSLGFRAQYSAATLIKTATDTWLLVGDLA